MLGRDQRQRPTATRVNVYVERLLEHGAMPEKYERPQFAVMEESMKRNENFQMAKLGPLHRNQIPGENDANNCSESEKKEMSTPNTSSSPYSALPRKDLQKPKFDIPPSPASFKISRSRFRGLKFAPQANTSSTSTRQGAW
eukprot:CAMPEP_0184494288 /NCGR_PEP_ID=MMETSP0113_2-20130426/28349_1 /TAXON_ID=91329 /ORGANISM="Norrisiella sphaerica, Strain BC52" /LENGTH=140 /DNA_ID=CAMNT_0026879991 /DNA_START=574 /DNA_END=993 /DNA_ORIENTATION=-